MSESILSTRIGEILKDLETMGLLVAVRIPVGPVLKRHGVHGKNPLKGMGDWLVWFKDGPVVSIELKDGENGKLEESQIIFQKRLMRVGHEYKVIRTLSAFHEFIRLRIQA